MHVLCLLLICISVTVQGYHWIEEGQFCQKRNKENGVCKHFITCESAIEEVRHNGRPEICSFDGVYPIVCCADRPIKGDGVPSKDDSISYYIPFNEKSISLKKCREYHATGAQDNSKYNSRISKIRERPHSALLGFPEEGKKVRWVCSGSLISEKFVLTAAHCIKSKSLGYLKHVRLGELDLDSADDDARPQDFTIKNTYVHPSFTTPYHNIALVELDKPATFTEYVKPACLGVTEDLNGTLPEVTGWGLISSTENDRKLGSDYMKFVSNEDCSKIYPQSTFLRDGIVYSQICAINSDKSVKSCHIDSGASLQITNFFYEFNNFPEIVGVASFGKQCGVTADVFTKVYPYISWIEEIVWRRQ